MRKTPRPVLLVIGMAALLTACGPVTRALDSSRPARDQFWSRIHALCGLIYRGRTTDADPDDSGIVMHIRNCTDRQVQMMIHVDRTHSRLLVLERRPQGLTLVHNLVPGPESRQWSANQVPPVTTRTKSAGDPLRQRFHAPTGPAGEPVAPDWEIRFRPPKTLHIKSFNAGGEIVTHMRFNMNRPLQPGVGPGWLDAPSVPG